MSTNHYGELNQLRILSLIAMVCLSQDEDKMHLLWYRSLFERWNFAAFDDKENVLERCCRRNVMVCEGE